MTVSFLVCFFSVNTNAQFKYGKIVNKEPGSTFLNDIVLNSTLNFDPLNVTKVFFNSPTLEHPYFHMIVPVKDFKGGTPTVSKISINGETPILYYIYVDGQLEINGNIGDSTWGRYILAFGNEQCGSWITEGDVLASGPDVYLRHISPDTTGYSIWKRVEQTLDDPVTGLWRYSWVASTDGFPDEYQMDHIIEIDASVSGHDQGYSGWVQLDDGRIFVVHYTDDTAAASLSPYANLGIPWIRGTFLELSDLPPAPPAGP